MAGLKEPIVDGLLIGSTVCLISVMQRCGVYLCLLYCVPVDWMISNVSELLWYSVVLRCLKAVWDTATNSKLR